MEPKDGMTGNNGHRHVLSRPMMRDATRGGNVKVPHKTGTQVVCGGCGWSGILIEDSDYARLLVRAIAGPQKG